jgi:predicted transcriptional regulator
MASLTIQVPEELIADIQEFADLEDMSKSEVIIEAVASYLEKEYDTDCSIDSSDEEA